MQKKLQAYVDRPEEEREDREEARRRLYPKRSGPSDEPGGRLRGAALFLQQLQECRLIEHRDAEILRPS